MVVVVGILQVYDRKRKQKLVFPELVNREMEKDSQEIQGHLSRMVINFMRSQTGLLSIFLPVMFSYSNAGVE